MTGLIDDLLGSVDDILGVRDSVGAVLHPVFMVTRTWTGTQPGEGTFADVSVQVLPSPGIKEFSHDVRLREGGFIKQGDIILRGVSRNLYAESDIDNSTAAKNIEKFYQLDNRLYTVIHVKENYLTWDVQIRKLSHQ